MTFLGWRLAAMSDALVAAAGFLLPAAVLMTAAAAGTAALPDAPWVHGALVGLQVARFATYTGTAPTEINSGDIERHRLSRAGNRRLNHACTWPR